MRILGFLVFGAVTLWLGDVVFYEGRYGKQTWLELSQDAQKAGDELRRWTRF
jgi:hypothetical protein